MFREAHLKERCPERAKERDVADAIGVRSGREATGSQTTDAGDQGLARGAAGSETGARPQAQDNRGGDMEERRETEQVLRPSSDGMGEGLTKDRS